jgi:hypothetical protein
MDELNGRSTICSPRSCRIHPNAQRAGSKICRVALEAAKNRNVWSIAAVEEQQEPDQNLGG